MSTPITTKNPAYKEVSTKEMLYLRTEEGMTNREIAEYVGLSYYTVLRYIGKQPDDLVKKAKLPALIDQVVPETPNVSTHRKEKLTQQVRVSLSGNFAEYDIDIKQSVITIKGQTVDAILSVKDCVQMIEELQEVIDVILEIDVQSKNKSEQA